MKNNITTHHHTSRLLGLFILLMLTLGSNQAWGQTDTDYSGTYYIGSDGNAAEVNNKGTSEEYTYNAENPSSNYYLVPASNPAQTNYNDAYFDGTSGEKPFLTTYKTGHDNEALWVLTQVTDNDGTYYYIMHAETKKYIIYEPFFTGNQARRKCMHLDGTSPSDAGKFVIVEREGAFGIMPKSQVSETHKFWNLADKNRNSRHGLDGNNYYGGLLGLYQLSSNKLDVNSRFKLEEYIPRPNISSPNKDIIVIGEAGATIYYTIDGTNPTATNNAGSGAAPLQIDMPENAVTLKAIAVIDNLPSCISSIRVVPNATITLDEATLTYNGSAQTRGVTSVKDGETTIPTNEYNVTYSNNTNAGTAIVNIEDKSGGEYIVYGSTNFTINPVEVTLTANSGTEPYDGTEKTVTGFTCNVDGLTFEGVSASGSGTDKGEYPVTFTGVTIGVTKDTSGNYVVASIVNGTLTITRKQLTITADSETKVYDGTPLTKNSYTNTELFEGDRIESVTLTGSQTNVGTSDNVPSAAVIKNSTDDDVTASYDIIYTNGTLEVTKKTLTINADAKSKAYGEADPTLTYASVGLVNGDAITGTLTRVAGENVGTYAITQGGLTAGNNYEISFTGANLTITKAELKIMAKNHIISYGDMPANNGVDYDGFAGTDNAEVLGGTLSYAYNYEQYGELGDYIITPSGLTSTNYSITYYTGTLTVKKRTIVLKWENTSFTYDREAHQPAAIAVGTVNSEEIAVTLTVPAAINAGDYTATASGLTGEKVDHYELPTNNTHIFTIAPKSLGDGDLPAEGITIQLTSEGGLENVKDGDITLTTNEDYTYDIHNEGSDQIVAVTGTGNYTGSLRGIYAQPQFYDIDGEGAGKATAVYMSSRNVNNFAGVNAYTVKSVNTFLGLITVNKLDYIPKGVPVLLLSDSDNSGFVVAEKDENIADISEWTVNSNLLKMAPSEGIPVENAQVYMFYKGEFVLAKEGTITEGKFYFYNPNYTETPVDPAPIPARASLMIVEEEPTGMSDALHFMNNEQFENNWYDLQGRKIENHKLSKGLYILNGRKVIVK